VRTILSLHINATTHQYGRFIVPLKDDISSLVRSREIAEKRLRIVTSSAALSQKQWPGKRGNLGDGLVWEQVHPVII